MASAPNPTLHLLFAAVRNLGAFALALAAVCAAINASLPSLTVLGISDKLDALRARRGEIDTVFIGSSRVYHAFDPAIFDAEMKARGRDARSFNFGIDGMRPPESFYVLREVLKLRLPLRAVFIELSDFQSKVNAANVGSARYVHWHDWRHTALVLRHIPASWHTRGEKCEQWLVHAACFLVRMSNIGRGQDWIGPKLSGPQKQRRVAMPWKDHAGYEPQTTPVLAGAARKNFETAVALIEANGMGKTAVTPLLAGALREMLAEVRAAGARPVLVISPTLTARENLMGLAEAGIDAPVIAFTDPRRLPGVFRAENHCDVQHLNPGGAAEFTRAVAEEVAALAR